MKKMFLCLLTISFILSSCYSQPDDFSKNELVPSNSMEPFYDESDRIFPIFDKIKNITISDAEAPEEIFNLNDKQREKLWSLMRVEEWEIASELPITGFPSVIQIEEEDQIWFFSSFEDHTLIIPNYPSKNGEKVCYLAQADILSDIIDYTETLKSL